MAVSTQLSPAIADDEIFQFDTVRFDLASIRLDQIEITDPDLLQLAYKYYKALSAKKIKEYLRFCKFLQWGRLNPVDFASAVFGIEMLDLQKYALINSWPRQFVLWLECRNAGKTTLIAIYVMLRSLLIPYHVTYLLGKIGGQSKQIFKKIEEIATQRIETFLGVTDVFYNELRKDGANSTGFKHDPNSFELNLFNNAAVYTLNSDPTNIKGKRASLVVFDEAGWFSDELFTQAEAFVNQNEEFKLGGDVDLSIEPTGFPRQLLYASSASDTNSGFYRKFKNISERMLLGDTRYFSVNFTADALLNAKVDGKPYTSLVSKDQIDKMMTEKREAALREYYNHFSADSFEGQIISRRDLMQCTENYTPIMSNDTGNRIICMSWDSARLNDNSVIVIAEFYKKKERDKDSGRTRDMGWHMRILNVVSLVDVKTKQRTPMRFPEQVERFKQLLLDYNGTQHGKKDYENIKRIICDAGAGGQIIGSVADYMLAHWTDSFGNEHKGIIDVSHKANESARATYPDAVDIMTLVDPRAHRNEIFDAIEKMVKLGVVSFPADPEGRDFITHIDDEGNDIVTQLTPEQMVACSQIELMKTEIVTMCKYVTQGNIRYDFPADKRNRMHDDRVFAFGLLCWYLAKLRRGDVVTRRPEDEPEVFVLPFRKPVLRKL